MLAINHWVATILAPSSSWLAEITTHVTAEETQAQRRRSCQRHIARLCGDWTVWASQVWGCWPEFCSWVCTHRVGCAETCVHIYTHSLPLTRMSGIRCWPCTCGSDRSGQTPTYDGTPTPMVVWMPSASPAVSCGGRTSYCITSTVCPGPSPPPLWRDALGSGDAFISPSPTPNLTLGCPVSFALGAF